MGQFWQDNIWWLTLTNSCGRKCTTIYSPVDHLTASVKREANGQPGQQQCRAWPSQHHLTFCWRQLDPDLAQHSQAPRYVPQWMTAWCIQSFLVWYCSEGVWLKTVGCMLLGKCSVTTTTKKEFTNSCYYNYITASSVIKKFWK